MYESALAKLQFRNFCFKPKSVPLDNKCETIGYELHCSKYFITLIWFKCTAL